MAESKSYTPSPKYAKIFEGGTLYLRKDGYLIFQKYETDENDKYRRVTFTGKTEEQGCQKVQGVSQAGQRDPGTAAAGSLPDAGRCTPWPQAPGGDRHRHLPFRLGIVLHPDLQDPALGEAHHLFVLYEDLSDPNSALLWKNAPGCGNRCGYSGLHQLFTDQRQAGQTGWAFPKKHL